MADDRERKPWERRREESFRAYAAFCVYRNLGADRSLTLAVRQYLTLSTPNARATKAQSERARYLTHPTPGKYLRNVRRRWGDWSRKHAWVARAEAYDAWILAESDRRSAEAAIAEADRQTAENIRRQALRLTHARNLQDSAEQARELALPVAMIRLKTAQAELLEMQKRNAPPSELAKAAKQASEDAISILHWVVKALPAGQKAELLNLGEVTDRQAHQVEGKGLTEQIVAALEQALGERDVDLPTLGVLRERLLSGINGNGNGGG